MRSLKEVLIKFHDMYEEFYWSVAIVHQHLTKLDILGEYETMDEVNLYLTDYYVALLDRYCKYFENPVDIDRFRNVELTLKDDLDEEELIWEFLYWFRLFILSDYKSVWNDPMRINYVYYLKTLYWNLAAFAVCNDEELEQRERGILRNMDFGSAILKSCLTLKVQFLGQAAQMSLKQLLQKGWD